MSKPIKNLSPSIEQKRKRSQLMTVGITAGLFLAGVMFFGIESNQSDTDGDLISNEMDIDDDNDGIPDNIEQYCDKPDIANSTSGSGANQDKVYWFNWTDTDFSDGLDDGDSQTFTLADGTEVVATIDNVVNLGNQGGDRYIPDDLNTWGGAKIHKLYNTPGTSEVFHSGGTNADNVSFDISFSATKNGLVQKLDYIFVDGESTDGKGEYIKATSAEGNWKVLEHYGSGAVFTGAGTQEITITNTENSGAGNTIFYVEDATTFSLELRANGGQAVGFGIFLECDTDNDGIFNHLDLDSDNDGIPDIVEAGGADDDGDGRADDFSDTNGDGLVNVFETMHGGTSILFDTDGDGVNDRTGDFDGDQVPNWIDLDSDNDGITDVREAGGSDTDANGQVDNFSTDTDSDGYADSVDGDVGNDEIAENSANALVVTSSDLNGDGEPDAGYPNANTDGTSFPNFLDIDSDDDGIVDNTEGQASTAYQAPSNSDSDGDGLDDAYDDEPADFGGNGIIPVNTDLSGEPDYLDSDSDEDALSDLIEGHDTDGDNIGDAASPSNLGIASGIDIDNDGLDDGFDNNVYLVDATNLSLKPSSHPKKAEGDDMNWRDESLFPVEWASFQATWKGEDGLLTWETALELNSSHFQVERAIGNTQLYQAIGKVTSNGTTTEISAYKYLDKDITNLKKGEKVFYRLKQIDIDGEFEYSATVEIVAVTQALSMKVYPNPASEFVSIEVSNGTGDKFIKILSIEGKIMLQKEIKATENILKIKLQSWAKGIYIVHIEDEEGTRNTKLVVK